MTPDAKLPEQVGRGGRPDPLGCGRTVEMGLKNLRLFWETLLVVSGPSPSLALSGAAGCRRRRAAYMPTHPHQPQPTTRTHARAQVMSFMTRMHAHTHLHPPNPQPARAHAPRSCPLRPRCTRWRTRAARPGSRLRWRPSGRSWQRQLRGERAHGGCAACLCGRTAPEGWG